MTQCLTRVLKFMWLAVSISSMPGYARSGESSAMCVPFPHSHLFCGQYISDNTAVYIDNNVHNYTEANNRLLELDNNRIFGVTTACRWIAIYTSCLSIYPHCNTTTQALVAPCMNDCLNYINTCNNLTNFVTLLNISADTQFILNCFAPFTSFPSVNVDTDNCYEFKFPPLFVPSSASIANTRLTTFSNWNASTEYCSDIQGKDIAVLCRAVSIPVPQIRILVNGNLVPSIMRAQNEVVVISAPLSYGEVVMFECQASTETFTSSITINLTYSCCMDDINGTQYSIGQHFMIANGQNCSCGNGGSITCNQLNHEQSTPTGIIVVFIITAILLITAVIVLMIFAYFLRKKAQRKTEITTDASMEVTSVSQSTKIKVDNEKAEQNTPADSKYNYLLLRSSMIEAPSSSAEIINSALTKHRLQKFTISNNRLKILELLGAGSFGQVYYGLLTSEADESVVEVAVKTIKEHHSEDDLDSFIAESVIMKNFKHKNILGLVGVSVGVENNIARPYIILPFMANKDLKKYLRSKRTEVGNNLEELLKVISYLTLVKMCCDVCHGMEYLASIKYVHRDLAARNCMVDKDLTIKIADFGLTKDIYCDDYYRIGHKAKVPIKWMPPESIHDRYYDEKTDVWSFGIVCWEVFSFGKQPYPGIEHQHILQHIESGNRLAKTIFCGDEMYQIMLKCWQLKNSDRPTFSTLAEQLKQHYSDAMESNTFNPYLQLVI